jgi:hypothetical protein
VAKTLVDPHTPPCSVMLRGRNVVALMVAVVAVLACGDAASSRAATPSLLRQVNAVRASLGLAPLRFDRIASRVAMRMARDDRTDRQPEVLEAQPDCSVCDRFDVRGLSTDPRLVYRSLGGRRAIHFGLWRSGWSASENLSVFFSTAALVLDPRARTFAVARTPLGMLVVAVTADPKARFNRAVRWPRGELDPRKQLWVEVVLPPGYGYPNLYDVRDGRELTVAYPLAATDGFRGARLVAFGLNTSLAYGRAYRVGASLAIVHLRTRNTPAAFLRRSWTFHSVNEAERMEFLDAVGATPTQLRALFAQLDGAVDVVGGSEACLSVDACEEAHGERASIGMAVSATREVIVHELGHVVFDLALDERGRRAFRTAFLRTGWDKACCIPVSELFADQVAHWALGEESSDPRWLPRNEFAHLLRTHAGYRPLSAVGLLQR